jgi:hypothetical protein
MMKTGVLALALSLAIVSGTATAAPRVVTPAPQRAPLLILLAGADIPDQDWARAIYWKPIVEIRNVSDRRVTAYEIVWTSIGAFGEKTSAVIGPYTANLAPGQEESIYDAHRRMNPGTYPVVLRVANTERIEVRIGRVKFADGTVWTPPAAKN